jgi:hypothetical protein
VLDNAYRRRHAARVEGNEKSRHQARKIRGAGGKKALERRGGNKRGGKRRARPPEGLPEPPQGSAIHGPRVKGRGWDNDWEGKKGEEMWGAVSVTCQCDSTGSGLGTPRGNWRAPDFQTGTIPNTPKRSRLAMGKETPRRDVRPVLG